MKIGAKEEQRFPINAKLMYEIFLMESDGSAKIDRGGQVVHIVLDGDERSQLGIVIDAGNMIR